MDAQKLASSWKRSRKPVGEFSDQLDDRKIPYLSHSKLSLFEQCPRCYHRRYILREREEESEAMRRGQAFHRAAAMLYGSLRDKASLPTSSRLLPQSERKTMGKETVVLVGNAIELLRKHRWQDHEVISIEEPFFMDLTPGLPPIIGITDLILRRKETWIVVDHKTSTQKTTHDPAQLVLYSEHVRRKHSSKCLVGVFDSYRLVPDLNNATKHPFQRIPVSVDPSLLPPLIARYQKAWKGIAAMSHKDVPAARQDCWPCSRGWNF